VPCAVHLLLFVVLDDGQQVHMYCCALGVKLGTFLAVLE
jgi:hypothetical protein